jgi:spore germination protein
MEIYIVQEGDTVYSISDKFDIRVEWLVMDNGLAEPFDLVIGQALVIAYPAQTHTVQEGDTVEGIVERYGITLMALLRNNPHLSDRRYIYPGEVLVIRYNTSGSIATNGFAYPYIKQNVLIKVLPNLTYLSVFNYSIGDGGEIIEYHNDANIVQTSLEYGVVPLLMLTSLTPLGQPNVEIAFDLLLSEENQNRMLDQVVMIMKDRGYGGMNFVFNYLNENSQELYLNFVRRISDRLKREGFLLIITINYQLQMQNDQLLVEPIDYSEFNNYIDAIIFLKFHWSTNNDPPGPISDITNIRELIKFVVSELPPEKIVVGKPFLGYDWPLPYIPNLTNAISLSIEALMRLARDSNAVIQFDEHSQTPFFYYNQLSIGVPLQHIVWFIDARSINALFDLISEYDLYGSGIWNIMIYHPQLWTMINSRFDTIKLI